MAKLFRDPTTDEYYIETAMDGEFVTLRVDPEGKEYLQQQEVVDGGRIPAKVLVTLEENNWLSVADQDTPAFAREPRLVNESETGSTPSATHDPHVEDLPSERLEPRPWMEQENVDRFKEETDPAAGTTTRPAPGFTGTPADRENAKPLAHPEDTAFARGVWFWVLVAAVVLIAVWVLFEIL